MENVRSQRLDMLQRRDRDTFSAIQWLRENQQLFRQPILEPVAVLVNIKDRRYEAQVEAFLGGRDFHSFVAQNEEDRETFLKEVCQWKMVKMSSVWYNLQCCVKLICGSVACKNAKSRVKISWYR